MGIVEGMLNAFTRPRYFGHNFDLLNQATDTVKFILSRMVTQTGATGVAPSYSQQLDTPPPFHFLRDEEAPQKQGSDQAVRYTGQYIRISWDVPIYDFDLIANTGIDGAALRDDGWVAKSMTGVQGQTLYNFVEAKFLALANGIANTVDSDIWETAIARSQSAPTSRPAGLPTLMDDSTGWMGVGIDGFGEWEVGDPWHADEGGAPGNAANDNSKYRNVPQVYDFTRTPYGASGDTVDGDDIVPKLWELQQRQRRWGGWVLGMTTHKIMSTIFEYVSDHGNDRSMVINRRFGRNTGASTDFGVVKIGNILFYNDDRMEKYQDEIWGVHVGDRSGMTPDRMHTAGFGLRAWVPPMVSTQFDEAYRKQYIRDVSVAADAGIGDNTFGVNNMLPISQRGWEFDTDYVGALNNMVQTFYHTYGNPYKCFKVTNFTVA